MAVVSSDDSGITPDHILAIQRVCVDWNTFLFVRPSTRDTRDCIQAGYATKSMDIHDKSSDWGPHAGLVPCDPAFSKALKGTPNANPHYHEHGEAKPVILRLPSDELATPGQNPRIARADGKNSTATIKYVTANPRGAGAKGKTFKLEKKEGEWEVSWLNGETAVPFWVWGYQTPTGVKPVTGDYDLWMVSPHISRWSQHTSIMGVRDSHGESGASAFITYLLIKLNQACGRADNHVFHHGAEAQNYGFTQAIDDRVVMFTPTGQSEMVTRSDLPDVLVDLQCAGYLVYWNKRYGESDPHFMGSAVNAGVTGGDPRLTAIEQLLQEAEDVKTQDLKIGKSNLNLGEAKAQTLIRKNLLGRGGEIPKIDQIQKFNKALQQGMVLLEENRSIGRLNKLRVTEHIPEDIMNAATGDEEGLRLLKEVQNKVIELSEFAWNKHGAVVPPDPEVWTRWKTTNKGLFDRLEQKYGKKQPVPLQFNLITGTRAYTAETDRFDVNTVNRLLGEFAAGFLNMVNSEKGVR